MTTRGVLFPFKSERLSLRAGLFKKETNTNVLNFSGAANYVDPNSALLAMATNLASSLMSQTRMASAQRVPIPPPPPPPPPRQPENERTCFRCGQPGHIAIHCPAKKWRSFSIWWNLFSWVFENIWVFVIKKKKPPVILFWYYSKNTFLSSMQGHLIKGKKF